MWVFRYVSKIDLQQLSHAFKLPHIHKWLHSDGLKNTKDGILKFLTSPAHSPTQYYVAETQGRLFALLIKSTLSPDSPMHRTHIKKSSASTIDVFILNPNDCHKGYGPKLISAFICAKLSKETVFIDPEQTNSAAIKAYKKVGFEIVDEFIADWHPVPHYLMVLDSDSG